MRSSFAAGTVGLSLLLAAAGPSAGQEQPAAMTVPAPQASQSLSDLLLPYSPYLFDAVVTGARSLAEVTYQSRRYDPIMRTLIVNGLEIDRDAFHMRIGQARIGAAEAVFEDVAVDTKGLPLDPTVRQVLQRLGREVVTGDIAVTVAMDAAQANYDLQADVRMDGAGRLDLQADVAGFHILVPLDELEGRDGNSSPELAGRLRSASASFTDAGLADALYEVVGAGQGMTATQARAAAAMTAGIAVASIFNGIPGGETADLTAAARQWSAAVQGFLAKPDRLAVTLRPAQPFDLSRLSSKQPIDAATILALNPSVASGAAPKLALRDPAKLTLGPNANLSDTLAVAQTLIEGRGVPQDIERAVTLLLPPARADNRAAIALLARALALDPGAKIPQDGLVGTYVALVLAKADGLRPAEQSLTAIRSRLSPAEIAAAEDDAAARWRQTPVGTQQRQAEIRAFQLQDWPTVRRLAFAYYEGVTMPRNVMRAYGWASIAAAGGDAIAARFRDELTEAVNSGRLVLPLDKAREATNDLWRLIIAEPAEATAPAPAAPASPSAPAGGADAPSAAPAPDDAASALPPPGGQGAATGSAEAPSAPDSATKAQ